VSVVWLASVLVLMLLSVRGAKSCRAIRKKSLPRVRVRDARRPSLGSVDNPSARTWDGDPETWLPVGGVVYLLDCS
jgi:hypothetical protein